MAEVNNADKLAIGFASDKFTDEMASFVAKAYKDEDADMEVLEKKRVQTRSNQKESKRKSKARKR